MTILKTKNFSKNQGPIADECHKRPCSNTEFHHLLNIGLADFQNGKSRSAEEVFKDLEERFDL